MSQPDTFLWRGVNFWAHIKNWYEVHSLEDNQRLLKDMVGMGFNDLWITLERGLVRNYFDEDIADEYSRQFWHKVCELGKTANQLGMRVTLLDEINTVFLDQYHDPVKKQYIAEGPRTYASLKRPWQFCPSKPEAREIILKNHEESFKRFPVIDALVLWPYDNGGCGCENCHPWPKTFVELSKILVEKLRAIHPQADVYLSTWDMTDEEKALFTCILTEDTPRTFQGIVDKEWMLIDCEDEQPVDYWTKIGLPPDYLRIPYIDLCQIGRWGWQSFTANPYHMRFEKMLAALHKAGITQFGSYSEDIHDDINKYLLARLGLSSKRSARELIHEYCLNYFQAGIGDEIFKAACMMEEEYTNKYKSPWVQQPVFDKDRARELLSILQTVEKRLPDYIVSGFRWQVLIKRAEISWLLNDIGEIAAAETTINEKFQQVLACHRVEDAKDMLRQILQIIDEKRFLLASLKDLIADFRSEVLEEPEDRGITMLGALESYFDWQKMLLKLEEKAYLASRGLLIDRVQNFVRQGYGDS